MTLTEPPRVVIEDVTPTVDAGRYPLKLPVGSTLDVAASVFRDGHDLVAARVVYLAPGEPQWRSAPLVYDFNPDRWNGSFRVEEVGRWHYGVEAWPDHFGTWRSELEKRRGRVTGREAQQNGPRVQPAALAEALDEALSLQCRDESGGRALRQPGARRKFADGRRLRGLDDADEQLRRAVDRLGTGLGRHLTLWNERSTIIVATAAGRVNR